jgi:membrane protease YdiL (CAAX protease family)
MIDQWELGATGLTLAYGAAVNRLLPKRAYVPANLTAATLFVVLARRSGATWADMGMRRDRAGRGLRMGLVATAPVAALLSLALALPCSRRLVTVERRPGVRVRGIAFELLVRVPLGTALPEEVIFRGALLGASLARSSQGKATAFSSVLFGLWHVLPTLDALALNPMPGPGARGKAGGVGDAVLVTTAAGFALARVRFTADSLVAPVVIHALTNALGLLAGRGGRSPGWRQILRREGFS